MDFFVGRYRARLGSGYVSRSQVDEETLAIFGPFGDGSGCEETWMVDLLRSMQCIDVAWIVIPASPSLYIRRQSARLESYGARRAFVAA